MVIKLVVLVLLPCLSLSLSPESVSLVSFNLQFFSSYSHQLSGLEGKNGNPTPILKISKPRSNSKTPGLARVPGRPAGSTEFHRANSPAGFYLNPDRSQTRVGPVPDPGRTGPGSTRRAGPGFKTMLPLHIINVNEQTMKLYILFCTQHLMLMRMTQL
jgi:hypothetical protein